MNACIHFGLLCLLQQEAADHLLDKGFESTVSFAQSLSQWAYITIGASVALLLKDFNRRPKSTAVRWSFFAFLPGWGFLGRAIYMGVRVHGAYIAYLINPRHDPETAMLYGRADAPVTLIEFADYQCPFCKRSHTDAYSELKKKYVDTGKVRFVSRDLPLEFHPLAMKAAEATRCAGDQGKYWELRDALYSNAAPPSDEVIKKTAEGLSLDEKGFQSCVASGKYKADVQKDANEAATLQISGTPTFVLAKSSKDKLDGVRMVGALPFAAFQAAIDGLLKN